MGKKYFTVKELAERWNLCPDTVRRMVRRGQLKAYVIGRSVRVSPEALESFEGRAVLKDIGA